MLLFSLCFISFRIAHNGLFSHQPFVSFPFWFVSYLKQNKKYAATLRLSVLRDQSARTFMVNTCSANMCELSNHFLSWMIDRRLQTQRPFFFSKFSTFCTSVNIFQFMLTNSACFFYISTDHVRWKVHRQAGGPIGGARAAHLWIPAAHERHAGHRFARRWGLPPGRRHCSTGGCHPSARWTRRYVTASCYKIAERRVFFCVPPRCERDYVLRVRYALSFFNCSRTTNNVGATELDAFGFRV